MFLSAIDACAGGYHAPPPTPYDDVNCVNIIAYSFRQLLTYHDNEAGPALGMLPKMLRTESEDHRVANGLEEKQREETPNSCSSWRERDP